MNTLRIYYDILFSYSETLVLMKYDRYLPDLALASARARFIDLIARILSCLAARHSACLFDFLPDCSTFSAFTDCLSAVRLVFLPMVVRYSMYVYVRIV